MARSSNPNSAGSQFYICIEDAPFLNSQYTVFGHVVEGQTVVDQIRAGDVMTKVAIENGPVEAARADPAAHRARARRAGRTPDWVGPMYDAGTRAEGYLRAYAREFASVEVDSTFYGTPPPERVRKWAAQVPAEFTFALKLTREITHDRRLLGAEKLLDEFVTSAIELGDAARGDPDPARAGLRAGRARRARGVRRRAARRAALGARGARPGLARGRRRTRGCARRWPPRDVALAVSDGTFVPLPAMLAELRDPTASHAYVRWLGRRDAVQRFDAVQFDRRDQIGAVGRGDPRRRAAADPPVRLRQQPLHRPLAGRDPRGLRRAGHPARAPGPHRAAVAVRMSSGAHDVNYS